MGYFRRGALVERFTAITTAGSTTTLTSSSTTFQVFQGTSDQTVALPSGTTMDGGSNSTGSQKFYLCNRSTGTIFINNNSGTRIATLNPGSDVMLSLIDDTSAAGVWQVTAFDPKEQPLKLTANTGADSKIKISTNTMVNLDGTETVSPPISSLIPAVVASTHDLQTGGTTGATFLSASLPTTTIGQFRRIGYTLLANGSIQVLYSAAAASLGALANAGTVFPKSGIAIGWVDAEATASNAFKTAGSATAIVENQVGGVSRIHRFGSGGGGGSGTGDASELLERLKEQFQDSSFDYMTPVIFSQVADALNDPGSTGAYDVATSSFIMGSGQTLVTVQMFDSDFLTAERDASRVELTAMWTLSAIDTAATYEVSRNGGAEWQTVTMERVGTTDTYRGEKTFTAESANQTLSSNANGTGSTDDLSNSIEEIAQQFVLANAVVTKQITASITKTGTPGGYYYFEIRRNNAGSPGDTVAASAYLPISALSAGVNAVTIDLGGTLAAGTYWLVASTSATYKSSYSVGVTSIAIKTRTGGTGTDMKTLTTSVWSTVATTAVDYTITGRALDLRVRVTASAAAKALTGLGISYGRTTPLSNNIKPIETFVFSGDLNTTEFQLTKFTPNPDLLRVYDVTTGQVYRYGAFTLSGTKVIFTTGQFAVPGQTVSLIFDQTAGGAFDNSDTNALLLAENRLGSRDATLDRSATGEGILLRASDGKLIEASVLYNSALDIYEWQFAEVV